MRDASDGSSQGVFFVAGPQQGAWDGRPRTATILGSNGFPQEQSFTNFFMTIV